MADQRVHDEGEEKPSRHRSKHFILSLVMSHEVSVFEVPVCYAASFLLDDEAHRRRILFDNASWSFPRGSPSLSKKEERERKNELNFE